MDVTTCKRVLTQISEIMLESNWHLIEKDVANKQDSQDIRRQLEMIVFEYETGLKEKL